ncbi:DeoR family transcriptional regulator [Actinomadura rubrobrunea]|uniref:Lactose phosphotransferase system repressor n=1 Tax=Actinomadura rubrobrunea TaxID=115335 RepID=A0A9W6UYV6_9ACTN|nr:DeoR/GlpR family DNA-binding transcription regulator [Actinomadura rubrobrunea]GLW67608.1 DeoR family transcriptional regulator [Actinomadura rubrobrunea]
MNRKGRPSDAAVERRRQAILRHVMDRGEARIDDLAARFGVSLMTVHRDLDALAERRLLRKLRGRVAALPSLTVESAERFRERLHTAEKEALCAAVADQVRPGTTVLLDDSTTLRPLARRLTRVEGLTVVTNSLAIATILGGADRVEVVLVGGRYRGDFNSCCGPDVTAALARITADQSFVSAAALLEGRLFHPSRDSAEVKEAMLAAARRNVLLVDHSKFGKTATYAYGDAARYDLVVTDAATPAEEIGALRALGVPVHIVHPG